MKVRNRVKESDERAQGERSHPKVKVNTRSTILGMCKKTHLRKVGENKGGEGEYFVALTCNLQVVPGSSLPLSPLTRYVHVIHH